jgi:hypothetical protein
MQYPIPIILQFREVAFAAFYAQDLFQRKKLATSSTASKYSVSASSHGGGGGTGGGRRLSSATAPSRGSILGGGPSLISLSSTNNSSASDFQQAMSWSDVLNMITILRDEQKGISSEVAHNDDDNSSQQHGGHQGLRQQVISPPISTFAGGNVLSTVREEGGEGRVKTSVPITAPDTSVVPAAVAEEPKVKEERVSSVEEATVESAPVVAKGSEENTSTPKKISLGISLKKGGPPVELPVPSLKPSTSSASSVANSASATMSSASKTASNLFSSMRQGFEQLASDQSKLVAASPNKHKSDTEAQSPVVASAPGSGAARPSNSVTVNAAVGTAKREIPPVEDSDAASVSAAVAPSRGSVVGDISRFNNLFAKSLNFLQEKEDELYGILSPHSLSLSPSVIFLDLSPLSVADNASESEDDWDHGTEAEYDFLSNNIHTNYAAMVDAARWVIRMYDSPLLLPLFSCLVLTFPSLFLTCPM